MKGAGRGGGDGDGDAVKERTESVCTKGCTGSRANATYRVLKNTVANDWSVLRRFTGEEGCAGSCHCMCSRR